MITVSFPISYVITYVILTVFVALVMAYKIRMGNVDSFLVQYKRKISRTWDILWLVGFIIVCNFSIAI